MNDKTYGICVLVGIASWFLLIGKDYNFFTSIGGAILIGIAALAVFKVADYLVGIDF